MQAPSFSIPTGDNISIAAFDDGHLSITTGPVIFNQTLAVNKLFLYTFHQLFVGSFVAIKCKWIFSHTKGSGYE